MSITDELRNHAHKRTWDGAETYDQHILYLADQIEEEMANYIELPKDADGVTIRIGDEVEVIGYEDGTVAAMQLDERRWSVAVRPHGWDTPTAYDAESIRHAKPDSWERIISEFAERVINSGHQWGLDAPETTAEFVERCKKLAGDVE